jgi:hypothetical protein
MTVAQRPQREDAGPNSLDDPNVAERPLDTCVLHLNDQVAASDSIHKTTGQRESSLSGLLGATRKKKKNRKNSIRKLLFREFLRIWRSIPAEKRMPCFRILAF